ncbi:unnamed protein product [Tilletia controversa]|nr:unnamed protein product [Tilletia controversa]
MLKLFKRGNAGLKQQQSQEALPRQAPSSGGGAGGGSGSGSGSGDNELLHGDPGSANGGDPNTYYRQPLVPPPHQYEHQHRRSHSGAGAYNGLTPGSELGASQYLHDAPPASNPYAIGPGSLDAGQQRPFSPESAQLRAVSPNPASGAYESYSEMHDSVPSSKADKATGKQVRSGSGGAAKLEKSSKKGQLAQTAEGKTTEKIAWLCGSPNSNVDWSHVLALTDSINSSEAAAKEAARAIRKEFKYGEPEAQRRAIRIWAILMMNASDRFRAQIATKRFLEVVEHVVTNSKTDPSVSEKMLNVLAVLAYLYQSDAELGIITKCWNKNKPKDRPLNGEPVDPESEDFNPPILNARSPRALPPRALTPNGGDYDARANGNGFEHTKVASARTDSGKNGTEPTGKKKPRDYSHRVVSADEDMRKLHEECHIGRTNAIVLIDALATSGLSSPLLEEFAHKVQLSQMFLVGQIDWASAQAIRSREYVEEQTAIAVTQGFEPPQLEETKEEILLADILAANERLMEAQQMLDDARRRQAEDDEDAAVRERSRVETRMARDAAGAPLQTAGGEGYTWGAPSSSNSGQVPPVLAPAPINRGANGSGPGLPLEVPIPQHARGPLPMTPPQAPSPQPHPHPHPHPLPKTPITVHPHLPPKSSRSPGDEETIQTPVVPSEKALGKRRAVSDRGDAFDPEFQAAALAAQAPVHVPVKLHEVLEQDDADQ